jgi:hypothetical protein
VLNAVVLARRGHLQYWHQVCRTDNEASSAKLGLSPEAAHPKCKTTIQFVVVGHHLRRRAPFADAVSLVRDDAVEGPSMMSEAAAVHETIRKRIDL